MNMKGISMLLGGIIVTFFVIIAALMPFLVTKVHIDRLILFEVRSTNANLVLISLLSSTHTDTLDNQPKKVSEIIAEYIALNDKPDISFLDSMLDNLVKSKSYKLFYEESGNVIVLSQSGNPSGYAVTAKIPLPYEKNRLYKDITLVID